jgi:hypothetical protein
MSTLYYCNVPNKWIKVNRYYEDNDDGFVQEVKVGQHNGRLSTGAWVGIAIPTNYVREYLIRIQKTKLDPNIKAQQRNY